MVLLMAEILTLIIVMFMLLVFYLYWINRKIKNDQIVIAKRKERPKHQFIESRPKLIGKKKEMTTTVTKPAVKEESQANAGKTMGNEVESVIMNRNTPIIQLIEIEETEEGDYVAYSGRYKPPLKAMSYPVNEFNKVTTDICLMK